MDKVTSLADLVFRAKTDRHYRQLARIVHSRLSGNEFLPEVSYEDSLKFLYSYAEHYYGHDNCSVTVDHLNYYRGRVVEEKDPMSVIEDVATPTPIPVPEVRTAKKVVIEMIKQRKKQIESPIYYQEFFRGTPTINEINFYPYNDYAYRRYNNQLGYI